MSKVYKNYCISLNKDKEAFLDSDIEGIYFTSVKVDYIGNIKKITSAVPYRINLQNIDFHKDLLQNLRTLTNGKYCDFNCKYHRKDLISKGVIPLLELCFCSAFHRSDCFIELELFKSEYGL